MCSVRLVRGVPVAVAPDRLDGETSRRLEPELERLAQRGYATIVVDLSNTKVCDHAGLAVLISAHERASAEGGELRLVGTSRALRRMSSPGGVPPRPRRFASLDEAVAELPAPVIAPPEASLGPVGTIVWLVRDNPRQRIRRTGRRARPMTAARA
jgi:anti-sigma B factor antagonist